MAHKIFLAHLQSMHKQLDFLVQSTLKPLEIREYMMTYELEMIRLQQPSSTVQPEQEEQTAIYQANTIIQELSDALDLNPNDPQLWMARGQLWLKIQDQGAAFSDFARALELLHVAKSAPQSQKAPELLEIQFHEILNQMQALHPEYTQDVLQCLK